MSVKVQTGREVAVLQARGPRGLLLGGSNRFRRSLLFVFCPGVMLWGCSALNCNSPTSPSDLTSQIQGGTDMTAQAGAGEPCALRKKVDGQGELLRAVPGQEDHSCWLYRLGVSCLLKVPCKYSVIQKEDCK